MNLKIANKLQGLRKQNGYSQEELAQKLGVSRQAISKWERAEASPDTENLILLAQLYRVSLDDLVKTDDDNKETKIEKLIEDEDEENNQNITKNVFTMIIPCVAVVVYLVMGIKYHLWHPGWIIFLLIPLFETVIDCVFSRRITPFCYPVLITVIYLYLGFVQNAWHPWWFIFLTIPLFYFVARVLDRMIKR